MDQMDIIIDGYASPFNCTTAVRASKTVALWFILRGDLLYVFPCVILFSCFSILLVLRLPRLGEIIITLSMD